MARAIILCSGGLDSVTVAFYAQKHLKYDSITLFFCNYSQRAYSCEKSAVKYFAKKLNASFVECDISWLDSISSSLINNSDKPADMRKKSISNTKRESDNWYVPCRNLLFISNALAYAESLFIKKSERIDIITGFKNDGPESFPDTTEKFVKKITQLSNISTKVKSNVISPLIKMDKEDIVTLASKYSISLEKTFSCYVGQKKHCGKCLACRLRKEGFYWANISDKTKYSSL